TASMYLYKQIALGENDFAQRVSWNPQADDKGCFVSWAGHGGFLHVVNLSYAPKIKPEESLGQPAGPISLSNQQDITHHVHDVIPLSLSLSPSTPFYRQNITH
ncbi:hypothetical protein KIPB_014075, partial [Kipferlia bialata]